MDIRGRKPVGLPVRVKAATILMTINPPKRTAYNLADGLPFVVKWMKQRVEQAEKRRRKRETKERRR